jgi:hypothetical protein
MPGPVDGSIWGSSLGTPGAVVRLVPGSNPLVTALAEVYTVPLPGFAARGADIDMGNDVPMSTGNLNDDLIAYANGRMVLPHVPYPIGFFAKGFDGRIGRSKSRMERSRPLGGQRRSHAMARGRWEGEQTARGTQLRPDPRPSEERVSSLGRRDA